MEKTIELQRPNFSSFIFWKDQEGLKWVDLHECESRNTSTFRIIQLADQKYNFQNFAPIIVNTSDKKIGDEYFGLRMLSFSTDDNNFDNVCPDFIFNHWTEVQIDDYEDTRKNLELLGNEKPETDMLGWRGANTHHNRNFLVRYNDKKDFDVEFIVWDRSNPERLTCTNYVSLEDHVRKWRYLIDVEGHGWSARLKFFFFSKRLIFIQDRPHKEWFFPKLIPWKHYVPVKRDLSDLLENLQKIKQNEELEKEIITNAFNFAQENLTRENAIQKWSEILTS